MPELTAFHHHLTMLFIERLQVDVPSVEADLVESGVLDSLMFVELLLQLEQDFGITISSETLEIDHFRSIAKIAEYLINQGAEQPLLAETGTS